MILVDSSVWIGLFRAPHSELSATMGTAIELDAATCGIVLQEVLQGITPAHFIPDVRRSLLQHHYLESTQAVFLKAAEYARRTRLRGIKLSTVDALIAATADHYGASLWTLDKDFLRATKVIPIRLYHPSSSD